MRDKAYYVIQRQQGKLWEEEDNRQKIEDSKVGMKKKEDQVVLRNAYNNQMNEKEDQFVNSCAMTQEEMKFQSHLM